MERDIKQEAQGEKKREEGRESIRGGGGSVCCAYILWRHPTVAVMKYREKQEALWCDSGPVHFIGTERGNTHRSVKPHTPANASVIKNHNVYTMI